jgi:predicted nucleic acid-binding protein
MNEEKRRFRVYLDTNVFIAAFEAPPETAQDVRSLFDELRLQPLIGVTSELTLAELLAQKNSARPIHIMRRFYLDLIVWNRFIDLYPTTRDVWLETAELRQHTQLKLPDAVHVVTAIQTGCTHFMSADRDIKLPQGMTPVWPDSEGVATIMDALRA